jgi:hypothetical protein
VSLDLAIMVVIAVLIVITAAALYWRDNRRAEAGRRDAGQRGE